MDSFGKKVKAFTLFETLIVVILLTLIVFMGMNLFGKVNEWYVNYLTVTKERIEKSSLYTHMKWDVQMANEIQKSPNGFNLILYPNKNIQYVKNEDSIIRISEQGDERYFTTCDIILMDHKIYCTDESKNKIFLIALPFQVEVK